MTARDNFSFVSLPRLAAAQGWQAQYKLIIDWGKTIAAKPDIRTPDYLIKGCELPVWLKHWVAEGEHCFALDADSNVIKGLAALLLVQVDGLAVKNLAVNDETVLLPDLEAQLAALGLQKHLTPSRNNGLRAIIARIYSLLGDATLAR